LAIAGPALSMLRKQKPDPVRGLLINDGITLLAGQMSADYIRAVPAINLTDDELTAVAAAIRRAIEDDRFPHAPRLDPLRAALGKFEAERCQPPCRRPRRQPKPRSARGDNLWLGVPP
jgi:hypothetical protein